MSNGQRAMRDAGGNCVRRCRIGVRHDSELNTVTGSCSYEPNSTKALKSLVSYIALLRMTYGKKERAPCRLGRGPRESSGDLLSRTRGPGTIGDLRLNFRVRDGNGCDPHSITAETKSCMESELFKQPQNDEAA